MSRFQKGIILTCFNTKYASGAQNMYFGTILIFLKVQKYIFSHFLVLIAMKNACIIPFWNQLIKPIQMTPILQRKNFQEKYFSQGGPFGSNLSQNI